MSLPISECLVVAASLDDKAYEELLSRWQRNIAFGSMTVFGCKCDPPCGGKTTQAKVDALVERLEKDPRLRKVETVKQRNGEPEEKTL